MANALQDLGDPVSDRVLVLNVLRGLSSTYDHLKGWIARQRPFPTFLQVWDDLALEEITRDLASGSSSPTPSALVAAPPTSSAAPATSLLGAAPAGQTGGGGAWTSPPREKWWRWWHRWPCFWGYQYRWGPSGCGDTGSGSRSCPCRWRYALAILQQPMVRAHLDVAVPGSGRGASSSAPAGGHVHRCCYPICAVLDPARLAQPAADLAWGVGPGRSGAVLQHHGTDAADQHRVDRRLGCLLPYHPRCRYPLLCPTPTPLLSFFHHGW